jgi:hypoxanthine phosphoribosyltransferase
LVLKGRSAYGIKMFVERKPPAGIEKHITRQEIEERVGELAKQISKDYEGKELLLVGVLKGAVLFTSDLMRELYSEGLDDFEVDFIAVSSYGEETQSSRQPRIVKDLDEDIEGRHVLIVEDIVDTGYSFDTLLRILQARNPASLKTCAFISKPSRREKEVPIDYLGMEVENVWVEGYGMDTSEKGRGYPFIGIRKNT